MWTSSVAHPDSVNAQLADFLCARRDEIIRAWLGRVEADPAIAAETVTTNQLRDHLPRMFDDLADTLRRHGSKNVAEQAEEAAEKHGAERWHQGFDVAGVLREIVHLREIFIYHLRVFEEQHPDFGSAARLFAHTSVHRFLDDMALNALEQFLDCEKRARRGVAGL